MNLLICTQKADKDDPLLGSFHRWITEFAAYYGTVSVICLEEGNHSFPSNVKVYSLGKTKGAKSTLSDRFTYTLKLFKYAWNLRKDYDTVFVHMNPIYLVEVGWLWKLMGKKIGLWYTHRQVDTKLRIAERYADVIFTAAKESFNLKSNKVQVTGHGIDVAAYSNAKRSKPLGTEPILIGSVGRITPIKDPITLIEAARFLKGTWVKSYKVEFIGSPAMGSDSSYSDRVKKLVRQYGLESIISFTGDVKPGDMPARFASMDVSVNLTPTGGLDRVVLESMASGVPVITSNAAFKDYFGQYSNRLTFERGNAEELANKIMSLFDSNQAEMIGKALQETAKKRADIKMLIKTITDRLDSLS